jgi:hypothetical protein
MKTLSIFILVLSLSASFKILAQNPFTAFIGVSKAIETNYGFHGNMFQLEEQIKLKPKIFFLGGINYLYSNTIPDRKTEKDYSHRSLIPDAGLQFKINNSKKNRLVATSWIYSQFQQNKSKKFILNQLNRSRL